MNDIRRLQQGVLNAKAVAEDVKVAALHKSVDLFAVDVEVGLAQAKARNGQFEGVFDG